MKQILTFVVILLTTFSMVSASPLFHHKRGVVIPENCPKVPPKPKGRHTPPTGHLATNTSSISPSDRVIPHLKMRYDPYPAVAGAEEAFILEGEVDYSIDNQYSLAIVFEVDLKALDPVYIVDICTVIPCPQPAGAAVQIKTKVLAPPNLPKTGYDVGSLIVNYNIDPPFILACSLEFIG